jgi:hypothetical protein
MTKRQKSSERPKAAWPRLPSLRLARRTAGPAESVAVMRPYMDDPQSRERRRARFWLTASVALFCLIYGFVYAFIAPFLIPVLVSPVIILLIMVIWALPDMRHPPIVQMEQLFFATVAAMVIWPNYLAIALPGLPWITVARLTGFPFAFFLAICASTSEEFRSEVARSLRAAPVIGWLAFAFFIIQFFSIVMSQEKSISIQKFVICMVFWTGAFYASIFLFMRPKRADAWAKLLWGMAIPVGLITLAEYKLRHVLWVGHIPPFLQINDDNVKRILTPGFRAYTDIYRAQGTFTNSLGLAEYLALTTPFIMHYMITSSRPLLRIAAGLSVPFVLIVILASGSRLGVVGFGLSVMIYGFVWALLRRRRNPGDLLASAIVYAYPVIFGIALVAIEFVGRLHKAFLGGGAQQASTDARTAQWHMGTPMILKNPIGYGIGRGAETLGYFDPSGTLTIDSYYLLVLLEYGVIGFVAYYGMLAACVFFGLRAGISLPDQEAEPALVIPASIALAAFLVIKSVYSNTDNHSLSFMLVGMVCALIYRARQQTGASATVPAAAPAAADLERGVLAR